MEAYQNSYSITKRQLQLLQPNSYGFIVKRYITVPLALHWDMLDDKQRGAVAEYLIQSEPEFTRHFPNKSLIEGKSIDGVVFPSTSFNLMGLKPLEKGFLYECKTTRTKSQRVSFSGANMRLLNAAPLSRMVCVFYNGPTDRNLTIYIALTKWIIQQMGWIVPRPLDSDFGSNSLGEDDWLGPRDAAL
jgi:hypothetical protein